MAERGRPKKDERDRKVTTTILVTREQSEWLEKKKDAEGKSIGDIIDNLLVLQMMEEGYKR